MVEDDVENDLDAATVQRLDHVAELVDRPQRAAAGTVGGMRRKERDRRIAPIVHQTRRAILYIECEYRKKFDGSDTEMLQVRDFLHEAAKCATNVFGDVRARMAREAFHVQFINDGARGRSLQCGVALPVVGMRIHDNALHRRSEVLPFRAGGLAAVVFGRDNTFAIGIEKRLFRVETETIGGIERPINSIGVELARGYARNKDVPVVGGAIRDGIEGNDARGPRVVFLIEKEQIDAGGLT